MLYILIVVILLIALQIFLSLCKNKFAGLIVPLISLGITLYNSINVANIYFSISTTKISFKSYFLQLILRNVLISEQADTVIFYPLLLSIGFGILFLISLIIYFICRAIVKKKATL